MSGPWATRAQAPADGGQLEAVAQAVGELALQADEELACLTRHAEAHERAELGERVDHLGLVVHVPVDAARVDALLRRVGRTQQAVSTVLQVADLTLDVDSHDVRRGGEEITLTNTEFELLRYLMENVGIVLSKQKILDAVWSYDFGGQVNVVELYISYLRKKIDADRPALIRTVRGAGYIMREPQ